MLVLMRRMHETVVINGNIRVTVVQLEHGRVELGFDAPLEITIDREEVFLRKERERQQQEQTRREIHALEALRQKEEQARAHARANR